MTAIDFPNSPSTNDTFTSGSTTWKYDGSKWKVVTSPSNLSSATPDALTPDQTGAAGTSSDAARADHTHAITAASAGTISYATAEGTATSFARSDHNHQIQAVGAFSAYLTSNQTINASTTTNVAFDEEDFDVSGWHDKTTNKGRYTPQKAGYYLLGCYVDLSTLSGAGKYAQVWLGLNNADHRQLILWQYEGYPNYPRGSASTIVYANGTTDYFTIRVSHGSTTSETVVGAAGGPEYVARFWGHYLGSA